MKHRLEVVERSRRRAGGSRKRGQYYASHLYALRIAPADATRVEASDPYTVEVRHRTEWPPRDHPTEGDPTALGGTGTCKYDRTGPS
jgi:hypothetical protein